MNEIVIRLSDADRRILEGLTGAVSLLASVLGSMQPEAVQKEIVAKAAADPVVEHPADTPPIHLIPTATAPVPAPDPEPIPPAPVPAPVSLGEFQKAIVTRCAASPEMKEKVQALVHKYAASVSAVPEGKRAEVLAAMEEL